ncbi:MAG: lysophospholipase [Bacteroidota bacterium]
MLHATDALEMPDGPPLFTRAWSPELDEVRAEVLLVHGIGEHTGRYAHVAAHLMMHGVRILAYDQRGHGESPGDRAYVEDFDALVRDLHHVRAHLPSLRATVAGLGTSAADDRGSAPPLFLLGHSLGGLVVARYVTDHGSDGLAGVVLSSPALRTDVAPLLQKVAGTVARFAPRLPTVKLDLKGLSRDPRVVRNYEEDPLTHTGTGVRARTGHETIEAMKRVEAGAFRVPLYVFHGTADRITSPDGSQDFVKAVQARIPDADATLRLYDGLFHETMNEPEKQNVLDDLTEWLGDRL